MKLKAFQVFDIWSAIQMIAQEKMPGKTAIAIERNFRRLGGECAAIDAARKNIIKANVGTDPLPAEKVTVVEEKIKEINLAEIEIDLIQISENDLENITTSPAVIATLKPLFGGTQEDGDHSADKHNTDTKSNSGAAS